MHTDPTGETAVPAPWIWVVPVPGARVVGGVLLVGAGAYAIYESCGEDDEKKKKNCQALYDSIISDCWSMPNGKKRMRCFQAALDSYNQCMEQD